MDAPDTANTPRPWESTLPWEDTPKRWKVLVTYLYPAEPGLYEVEELDEIADIIERGPDWRAIADIRITLNRLPDLPAAFHRSMLERGLAVVPVSKLTDEQAAMLGKAQVSAA
jgi:hypothetical protein